jgi:hypothetical protein
MPACSYGFKKVHTTPITIETIVEVEVQFFLACSSRIQASCQLNYCCRRSYKYNFQCTVYLQNIHPWKPGSITASLFNIKHYGEELLEQMTSKLQLGAIPTERAGSRGGAVIRRDQWGSPGPDTGSRAWQMAASPNSRDGETRLCEVLAAAAGLGGGGRGQRPWRLWRCWRGGVTMRTKMRGGDSCVQVCLLPADMPL